MTKLNKILIFVIVLLVLATIFIFTTKNKVVQNVKRNITGQSREYGIWTNAYASNPGDAFDINVFEKQVTLWKNLDINHVRTNFEHIGKEPVTWVNDLMVNSAYKNGFNFTFVVEHHLSDFFSEANFDSGYEWGKIVGSKYPGKVDYYQLANEVSGTVIYSNHNGLKKEDYDPQKYQILKNYLLGLSAGLKEANPNAKQVVSAHWLGIAIIDMLIEDGLNFDVIGWNWYSEMGDDITQKKLDEGEGEILDIPGHFNKYKKKFWITELNYSGGDMEGEMPQATYLEKFLQNSINSKEIDGFFIYKLVDAKCTEGDKPTSYLGIVEDQSQTNTKSGCDIGEPKKAFYTYRDFIKKQ